MTAGHHTGPAVASAPWRLEMFGGLRLWHNGQIIEKFPTRKTAGVLAYLACHPNKAVSRDTLADLFWADTDPESARNSLRVALNALRKLLANGGEETELLLSDRLTVRLEPSAFATDLAEFEGALRDEVRALTTQDKIAALRRAVSLYRGAFLAGWYEEWVDAEQNRLGEVFGNVLRRLTANLLEVREYDEALEFAQQAVQSDPLREESHRLVIRLHMAMGNPAAAMQQYRELERILRKELGAIPSGATRELLRQVPSVAAPAPESRTRTPQPAPTPIVPTPKPAVPVGNVPVTLTQFFGREQEIQHLSSLLLPADEGYAYRLVTLTGMGGTGKSRLAIETSRRLQEGFGGNVWFIPLVGASTLTQVAAAIASGLRIPPHPEMSPIEQIVQFLVGKRHLLVLDNFEQAIDSSAAWLKELLERLPLLTCLVTSRFRLNIVGEQEAPVSPLPSPSAADVDSAPPERLTAFASVALFVDRARAARSDFRLSAQNASAVAALCTALDGLPLAIELVAAWTRLLPPAEMRNRLHERFDLLVSSHADVPARHRSLRAVLDESYDLISDDDKRFFARIAIFQGGWNLEAAESITGEAGALERLNLLQQRSLVLTLEWEGQYRFRMLETVREYAASRLLPDERTQFQKRHAAYYARLVEETACFLNTSTSELYLSTLDIEHDNIRAALDYLLNQSEEQQSGIRLAGALWRYWYARGHVEEGIHWLETALRRETDTTDLSLRITVREGLGRLSTSMGRNAMAARFLRHALELAWNDAPQRTASLAMNLGLAAQASSDAETALYAFQIVADRKHDSGDGWGEAAALVEVAKAARTLGDETRVQSTLEAARRLRDTVGDYWGVAEIHALLTAEDADPFSASGIGPVFLTLGEIAAEQGDHAIAIPLLGDALSAFREQNDRNGIAICLERIALSTIACGERETAVTALEEALTLRLEGTGRDSISFTRDLLEVATDIKAAPVSRPNYPAVV